jgi:hypothetical protein
VGIWGYFSICVCHRKKEHAKKTIPLTVCKGQALRVFEKKSPHLCYASGSIFYQKTLTAAAAWQLYGIFFFSSFFGGKNIVFCFSKSKLKQSKA